MGANLELAVHVLAALLVILAATTVCGRLAMLVKQPRVVGEMVAGVLLGPTLLGAVAPGVQEALFDADTKGVLYVLSTVGLMFYMFLVGLEVDHSKLDRRATRRAGVLAVSGILPTFVLGAAAATMFYDLLSTSDIALWKFMLFLGGALSITAFPMLARILQERDMAGTPLGGLTLLAAAIDDAVAWAILAIIIAVAAAGDPTGAVITIGGAAVFALVMLTVGKRALTAFARGVERDGVLRRDKMAVVLGVVVAAGYFTDMIGIFSVFGGFITGLAMPHLPVLRNQLRQRLTDLNSILLLPVFFAFSGLNTRLDGLSGWAMIVPLVVILVVAVVGKYTGCALVARWQGSSWREASAIGALMNARGLMILVFINIGLSYGLISTELFAILVITAIVTTALAMPLYRASLPTWMEDAEREIGRAEGADGRADAPPPARDEISPTSV
ncbi:cation:proton antiporter [Actinophytocola sp. NPDC049390]|uniref:cation:proton antiporter n=1 Tax=Actinophytocola sp. NPDC049390 TaxID=3363894 RepID=UPI0037978FC6